jgi:hypothetical protein
MIYLGNKTTSRIRKRKRIDGSQYKTKAGPERETNRCYLEAEPGRIRKRKSIDVTRALQR